MFKSIALLATLIGGPDNPEPVLPQPINIFGMNIVPS